eukprot:Amastigsp_a344065_5.p2 type:complete len:191 gc:universal Amastigsp_a344065_5:477-1049(+)
MHGVVDLDADKRRRRVVRRDDEHPAIAPSVQAVLKHVHIEHVVCLERLNAPPTASPAIDADGFGAETIPRPVANSGASAAEEQMLIVTCFRRVRAVELFVVAMAAPVRVCDFDAFDRRRFGLLLLVPRASAPRLGAFLEPAACVLAPLRNKLNQWFLGHVVALHRKRLRAGRRARSSQLGRRVVIRELVG